jgi:hypothetical protein
VQATILKIKISFKNGDPCNTNHDYTPLISRNLSTRVTDGKGVAGASKKLFQKKKKAQAEKSLRENEAMARTLDSAHKERLRIRHEEDIEYLKMINEQMRELNAAQKEACTTLGKTFRPLTTIATSFASIAGGGPSAGQRLPTYAHGRMVKGPATGRTQPHHALKVPDPVWRAMTDFKGEEGGVCITHTIRGTHVHGSCNLGHLTEAGCSFVRDEVACLGHAVVDDVALHDKVKSFMETAVSMYLQQRPAGRALRKAAVKTTPAVAAPHPEPEAAPQPEPEAAPQPEPVPTDDTEAEHGETSASAEDASEVSSSDASTSTTSRIQAARRKGTTTVPSRQ